MVRSKNKKYDFSAFKIPLNIAKKNKIQNKTMGVVESKKVSIKKEPVSKESVKRTKRTMW